MRRLVEDLLSRHPELFPTAITRAFTVCGTRPPSRKLAGVCLRRVRVTQTDEVGHTTTRDFFLRPSVVLPDCCGTVDDAANGALLLSSGVPYPVVASCFGRNALSWSRLERSLGRNSVVGTTVRDPRALPPHLAADEPQAQLRGEDASVAMIAGGQCLLGIARSNTAGEADLTAAYGRFQGEAADVSAAYTPETVNTDGWRTTQAAWRTLVPKRAVIVCLLHGFVKIRDRGRKASALHRQVWQVYRATSAQACREARESFRPWCVARVWSGPILEALEKRWGHTEE